VSRVALDGVLGWTFVPFISGEGAQHYGWQWRSPSPPDDAGGDYCMDLWDEDDLVGGAVVGQRVQRLAVLVQREAVGDDPVGLYPPTA
jgi:hypothetical protein